jgi:hypothetical protein
VFDQAVALQFVTSIKNYIAITELEKVAASLSVEFQQLFDDCSTVAEAGDASPTSVLPVPESISCFTGVLRGDPEGMWFR